jgi:hypothetical protein
MMIGLKNANEYRHAARPEPARTPDTQDPLSPLVAVDSTVTDGVVDLCGALLPARHDPNAKRKGNMPHSSKKWRRGTKCVPVAGH